MRLGVLLFSLALPAYADILTGKVIGITDGDTITVLDDDRRPHKIRLTGIDAPEKAQAFGQRSRQKLADMVFSHTVIVEREKRDRYGRLVGKVIVNGVDANLEQIKSGMAWWYETYRKEQTKEDQRKYAEAELEARAARVGLWRDTAPVPPWKWRQNQRGKKVD